jgi:5-methylcytosine-specific restriction enzyme A
LPTRAPTHKPPGWQPRAPWAHTQTSSARGYGSRWRKLRTFVLAREPLCRACAADGRTKAATHVDHVKPKAEGGTDAVANLQPLCSPCHAAKSAREGANGRRGG